MHVGSHLGQIHLHLVPTMNLLGLLDHLLNFVAPALVVGLMVAALAPRILKKAQPQRTWLAQGIINAAACFLALLLGLVFFGRDGKMGSYAAMVLACASSQWFFGKAWRA
jgi:hypothetical protein